MTANVSTYANTFACQNPGKIFLLRTWQTVMDNNLSACDMEVERQSLRRDSCCKRVLNHREGETKVLLIFLLCTKEIYTN